MNVSFMLQCTAVLAVPKTKIHALWRCLSFYIRSIAGGATCNLDVWQSCGALYYVVAEGGINVGVELLVDYGDEYRKLLIQERQQRLLKLRTLRQSSTSVTEPI